MFYKRYLFKILALASLTVLIAAQDHPDWETKVDKQLQEELKAGKTVSVLLTFSSTREIYHDIAKDYANDPNYEIAEACWPELDSLRVKDQLSLQNALRELEFSDSYKVKFDSLWLTNRLYIDNCNLKCANIALNEGKNLVRIGLDTDYPNWQILQQNDLTKHEGPDELTWGLKKIEIEKAWELVGGAEKAGLGARVGIMDTGFDKDATLINGKYDNRYGYFDPSPTGNRRYPADKSGHGTHATGTIVGDKGIGVAPGAEFLSCVACEGRKGCPQYYIERCAQYLFCPNVWGGASIKGCGKIADVVLMSFGVDQTTSTWLEDILLAFTTVKIIPVIPAGNGGGKCKSLTYPGSLKNVLTVGASTENDGFSEFTSFGPVEGNKYPKPDFVAPGTNIRSAATPGNGYSVVSGSASAAAHVAGLVAIIRGKKKGIDFDTIRSLISNNTDFVHPRSDTKCDDKTDDDKPNFKYGYGRINAFKTIAAMK